MTTIRPIVAALLCGGALVTATPVAAQLYLGGGLGWSDYKAGNASNDISSGTVDGEDTGWKLFGGYQFNRNFGFELSYLDLGRASYSGTLSGAPVTSGSLETTGVNLSVVGTLPLTQNFDLFGKLGAFAWETKTGDLTAGVAGSRKDDGTDVSYGVGVAYNFTPQLALRGEWEKLKAHDDIDFMSVSMAFKF
jgi:OOP family OmpA-OmpF porin